MRISAILMLAAAIPVFGSCDDSPSDVHEPVSGVWQVRIPSFGDSLDVQLGFGFDEVTHSTADGGVRAQVMPKPGSFGMSRVMKEGHTVSRVEHVNGKTEIIGTVHLGAPFMTLEFSGTIDGNNNFAFRYKSPAGSGNAVALYAGAYVRPATPALYRGANASVLDGNAALGAYAMSGTLNTVQGCGAGGCAFPPPVALTGTLNIYSASPDGYGGTTLTATYTTPYPGLNPSQYPASGDLYGAYFNIKLGGTLAAATLELDSNNGFDGSVGQTFDAYMEQHIPAGFARWDGSLTRTARQ